MRETPTAPRVFISSAMGGSLHDVRAELDASLKRAGFDTFRFETFRTEHEWAAHTSAENEATCLTELDRADLVLCLFRSAYGGSRKNHLADVGLTDLEFFHALQTGKPILIYLLEPFTPEPELAVLIQIMKTLLPDAIVNIGTSEALRERLIADVSRRLSARVAPDSAQEPRRFRTYCRALIANRRKDDDEYDGLRFLRGRYPPGHKGGDLDELAARLRAAEDVRPHDLRLTALWDVLTGLFAVPWREHADATPLWDRVLGDWGKSSAWSGQHGLLYAGALAAHNTVLAVRAFEASRRETDVLRDVLKRGESQAGTPEPWLRLYGVGGALASEYYSVAGLAPWKWRRHFLWKADQWCEVATRCRDVERRARLDPDLSAHSAVASIRGEVRLALGDTDGGIKLLQDSLEFRKEAKLPADSIGWAEVALGYAEFLAGRRWSGVERVERGVQILDQYGSPGFVVRARKRLAHIRLRQWKFREAVNEIAVARDIAERNHLHGQRMALDALLPLPIRWVFGRNMRPSGLRARAD